MNRAGFDLIKRFEGFRGGRYLCPAGKPTIGYGHVIQPGDAFNEPITEEFAEKLLLRDVARFEARVIALIHTDITENQLAALVSLAYNIGVAALRESILLRLINTHNMRSAALEFGRWNHATVDGEKVVLDGLTARRKAERELFETKEESYV